MEGLIGSPKDYQIYAFTPDPGSWSFRMNQGVTVIHLPTGIKATHQSERSQYENRKKCLDEITEKLLKLTPNPAPIRES